MTRGGGRGIAEIGKSKSLPLINADYTDPEPRLGYPGMPSCKRFRILVDGWGEGLKSPESPKSRVIAEIGKAKAHRGGQPRPGDRKGKNLTTDQH
jgi:hypothetical protein